MMLTMRFIIDGPDIPNDLLRKWRKGEVLFLAGAGVSVPSQLPLFKELTLGVYEELHDRLFAVLDGLRRYRNSKSITAYLNGQGLSAQERIECDLFATKQFDRCFSALERRIDPDIKGHSKTRRVRSAVETILSHAAHSDSHLNLIRLSTVDGPASEPRRCRLATTNFDLLFEDAWTVEFAESPISFDGRIAPRPGAHDFKGIIHLHGKLEEKIGTPGNYILSSRDFARVYLRSGVIGNYVYDLIRKYTVVLVGYAADDPPMRYLMDAIGEDTSIFDDMRRPFAIAARTDAAQEIDEEAWRAKEIEPILYKKRTGKEPFAPLWETIHAWADWAQDDLEWVLQQLRTATSSRRAAAPAFQLSFVQDLLSLLEVDELEAIVAFLNSLRVDFAWIESLTAAIEVAAVDPGRSIR